MAEQQQAPSKPATELKHLDSLVGKWVTEWKVLTEEADPHFRIIGTDTYEWMDGGFFLIHHVDVRMQGEPYRVIEIIGGYDEVSKSYPMHSFDSQGNASTMTATVDAQGIWTFEGETSRATLTVDENGDSMSAHWEQRDGSTWKPWMDMRFTRIR